MESWQQTEGKECLQGQEPTFAPHTFRFSEELHKCVWVASAVDPPWGKAALATRAASAAPERAVWMELRTAAAFGLAVAPVRIGRCWECWQEWQFTPSATEPRPMNPPALLSMFAIISSCSGDDCTGLAEYARDITFSRTRSLNSSSSATDQKSRVFGSTKACWKKWASIDSSALGVAKERIALQNRLLTQFAIPRAVVVRSGSSARQFLAGLQTGRNRGHVLPLLRHVRLLEDGCELRRGDELRRLRPKAVGNGALLVVGTQGFGQRRGEKRRSGNSRRAVRALGDGLRFWTTVDFVDLNKNRLLSWQPTSG